MARKFKVPRKLTRTLGRHARFLLRTQLLTVFLVLCALGALVGALTRPSSNVVPYGELFSQMSVVSYRESPSDTTARFVVELSAGGKVFRQYDVDARTFLPPSRDRDYNRAITGTFYRPLQARGHVAQGLWLAVSRHPGRRLLPQQFDELYQATLDFVKPVSMMAGVLGTLSGYSVGYRFGTWNSSLRSRAVQERVLATPGLGRVIAREAWRRVLLEPVVMVDEEDATRFAAVQSAQRIYANFFRIALNDSDGFIPREAGRLSRLGRAYESRGMLAFAEAARHAAVDSLHLSSADFAAVERWASLLVRRGHWAYDAIPPGGEERAQYVGMLAWYGVAPPAPEVDRVWVGPRVLVREGDAEGFVSDEIPATETGCPIAWRTELRRERTGANAMTKAWLADRPEFAAFLALGRRVVGGLASAGRRLAARPPALASTPTRGDRDRTATTIVSFASRTPIVVPSQADSSPPRLVLYSFNTAAGEASITLVTADSAAEVTLARAAQAVFERVDSTVGDGRATSHDRATGAAAETLRTRGVRDALVAVPGSVVALGSPPSSKQWSIGIHDPRKPTPCYARLGLRDGQAASTAGEYEQFIATGDRPPASRAGLPTGNPVAHGLVSVIVLARSTTTADSACAALLALNADDAKRQSSRRSDLSVILVERDTRGVDTFWVESDLREWFASEECADRYRVAYY